MDSIQKNLQATQNLLSALEEDPSLLENEQFIKKLSILRSKHEETTSYLASKVGSNFTINKWEHHVGPSEHNPSKHPQLHPRYVNHQYQQHCHYQSCSNISPHLNQPPENEEISSYNMDRNYNYSMSSSHYPISSIHTNNQYQNDSVISSNSQSAHPQPHSPIKTRQSSLASSYYPPSTVIHNPRHSNNLATSSHVVEENYYDDGLSTTREIPTIIDEEVLAGEDHFEIRFPKEEEESVKAVIHRHQHHNQKEHSVKNGYAANISTKSEVSKTDHTKRSHNKKTVTSAAKEAHKPKPVVQELSRPHITVPQPFQLTVRKSIENTYAKKFMNEMIVEKKMKEVEDDFELRKQKFKAKPVPSTTYVPQNNYLHDDKYIAAMRRKVAAAARRKFEQQNDLVRSKSEGNLSTIKPVGYIPPSTYISPIPVKPNARSRSATRRSAQLIKEATTPKGIKSHQATSNLTFSLRHDRCRIEKPRSNLMRRNSPPDFDKIHATMDDHIRKVSPKPSTVPVPFTFEYRTKSKSPSSSNRHLNCAEQKIEKYSRSQTANLTRRAQSGGARQTAIPTTHAAQLREELNRAKIQKEYEKVGNGGNEIWKDDNKKRIASFLGSRSKTDEDIAIRTREKLQKQQETTRDYMRQLVEMKQRVLNGPLIMEKQTALAQEHRLQRKFDQRMKNAKERSVVHVVVAPSKPVSRRGSQGSGGTGGTFVVAKQNDDVYEDDFESSKQSSSRSSKSSRLGSSSGSGSRSRSGSDVASKPKSGSHSGSRSGSSSKSSSSSTSSH